MSRWLEQYQNHAYTESWRNLKKAVDEIELGDEPAHSSVEELSRLRKVVYFLDELLNSLEPELVPFQLWDNFHNQCNAVNQNINQYIQDRNVNNIRHANDKIDSLLGSIRPHVLGRGEVATSLRDAVVDATKEVSDRHKEMSQNLKEIRKSIEQHESSAKNKLDEITQASERISDVEKQVFGDEGYAQKFNQLIASAEERYQDINTYYEEIFHDDAGSISIKNQVGSAKKDIESSKSQIDEQMSSVSDRVDQLKSFYKKIFGDPDNTEENKGLKAELEVRKEELEKFERDQKERYEALNTEINSLLPGATSAGLATAYHDLKKSFDKPIKNANFLFYCSIGGLVLLAAFMTFENFGDIQGQSWDVVLKSFIYRLPLYGPILWLAFYASKRRSEHNRLQQEYAHKEALAKSYHSYKQQIEALNTEDEAMLKSLMVKSIDAISHNASDTLDKGHGDKHPLHEIAEKTADKVVQKTRK